jgi:hypothetical protein
LPAEQPAIAATPGPSRSIYWLTLGAATVMACGVGMVRTSTTIDGPMTSPDQVRRNLAIPIVGVVTADTSRVSHCGASSATSLFWSCLGWLAGGLVLILIAVVLITVGAAV